MKKPVLLLVLIFAAAFAGQYDLLVCHCDPGSTSGVQTNIGGDPYYDSVDLVDCGLHRRAGSPRKGLSRTRYLPVNS